MAYLEIPTNVALSICFVNERWRIGELANIGTYCQDVCNGSTSGQEVSGRQLRGLGTRALHAQHPKMDLLAPLSWP